MQLGRHYYEREVIRKKVLLRVTPGTPAVSLSKKMLGSCSMDLW